MLVSSTQVLPQWLQVLLTVKFFNACTIHVEEKKNEKNVYCSDCCISICPHCFSAHRSHRLLRIRRYVYHDVLRLLDAQKLLDCKFIQAYTNNGARVVFLRSRPQTTQLRVSDNVCSTCDRSLHDPNLFCSISCKIDHVIRISGVSGLSSILFDYKFLAFSESGSDTPDSVLEPADSTRTSSDSVEYGGSSCIAALASTAITDIVRKKRSSLSACIPTIAQAEISAALLSRRKKTPNRSPLY